jgi:hypothetical protein
MARQGDDYYLVLTDTVTDDSGVVMANAANSSGEAKSYSKLSVESGSGQPPEFKKLFYDRHVQPGDSLRLDAVILGAPKPKVKWLFNGDVPAQENCRCTMAGDTYSFVLDSFDESNCGRYSIVAENTHGKATCSAEILFEGTEFSPASGALSPTSSSRSQSAYHEETVSTKTVGDVSETVKTSKQMNIINNGNSTVATESKSIETVPLSTRDLSTQSFHPQMRETGIQIATDVLDKSCQWMDNNGSNAQQLLAACIGGEAAPLVGANSSFEQQRFASSSKNESSSSYSYAAHQSSSFATSGGATTLTTLPHVDFSTTLIKDINQHSNFEPVELIINQGGHYGSGGCLSSGSGHHHMHGHQCDHHQNHHSHHNHHSHCDHHQHHCGGHHHHHQIMDEFNCSSASHRSHHHQQMHHSSTNAARAFEPINLIIQKPCSRSGSLPPLISKLNLNSSSSAAYASAAYDASACTDDESAAYYYYCDNKENSNSHRNSNSNIYYKAASSSSTAQQQRTSRPTSAFKPVELILDASSLSTDYTTIGKRYRDSSLPSAHTKRIRMPIQHTNMNESSFIYDASNNNNNNTINNCCAGSTLARATSNMSNCYYDCSAGIGNGSGGCVACSCNCSCNNCDYDYRFNSSDFLSGSNLEQHQHQHQQHQHRQQRSEAGTSYKFSTLSSSAEDSHRIRVEQQQPAQFRPVKFPTMEMTIDLKSPPVIEQPLTHISVYEGQSARLECVLNGNLFLFKVFFL